MPLYVSRLHITLRELPIAYISGELERRQRYSLIRDDDDDDDRCSVRVGVNNTWFTRDVTCSL